jgi:hypothetical protein
MANIVIRTVADPSLSKSLRDILNMSSTHRTYTGAARRLLKLDRDAADWFRCVGLWGHFEVEVDGKKIDKVDVMEALDKWPRDRTVNAVARDLEAAAA